MLVVLSYAVGKSGIDGRPSGSAGRARAPMPRHSSISVSANFVPMAVQAARRGPQIFPNPLRQIIR